jgi:hypothetical protein
MLKHRLFLPLISTFLTAGIMLALLFLTPKNTFAAEKKKGCEWVASVPGTAYNVCQAVSHKANCLNN